MCIYFVDKHIHGVHPLPKGSEEALPLRGRSISQTLNVLLASQSDTVAAAGYNVWMMNFTVKDKGFR